MQCRGKLRAYEDVWAVLRDLCHGVACGAVFWPLVVGHAVLARVPPYVRRSAQAVGGLGGQASTPP